MVFVGGTHQGYIGGAGAFWALCVSIEESGRSEIQIVKRVRNLFILLVGEVFKSNVILGPAFGSLEC